MDYGDGYIDLSDEDDFLCVGGDCISSDEDAEDFNLYNAIQKAARKTKAVHNGEDEDEFEKEMAAELSATISSMANKLKPVSGASSGTQAANAKGNTKLNVENADKEFYDEVYFDSDDSDNEGETEAMDTNIGRTRTSEKRRFMSNDELLYDPNMDDRDQAWVDEKRRSFQPKKKIGSGNTNKSGDSKGLKLPQSDAVLNCPACLTTLTRDCQRHVIHQNQYRAMFTSNCIIDFTQKLSFPKKEDKKNFFKNKKKNKNNQNNVGQMLINNVALVVVEQNSDDKKDKNEVENSETKSESSVQKTTNDNETDMVTKEKDNGADNNVSMESESSESNNLSKSEGGQPSNDKPSTTQANTQENMQENMQENTQEKVTDASQSKLAEANEWHRISDPFESNKKKSKLVYQAPVYRGKASKDSIFGSAREANIQHSSSKISTPGGRDNHLKKADEFFHPVSCSICNTKVAVYDNDEVYHFFNTVTSY